MSRKQKSGTVNTSPKHWHIKQAMNVLRPKLKPWFPDARGGGAPAQQVLMAAIDRGLVKTEPHNACWNIVPSSMKQFVKRVAKDAKLAHELSRAEVKVRLRHRRPKAVQPAPLAVDWPVVHEKVASAPEPSNDEHGPMNGKQIQEQLKELEYQAKKKVEDSGHLLFLAQLELKHVRELLRSVKTPGY
jgi:hypothetical protein